MDSFTNRFFRSRETTTNSNSENRSDCADGEDYDNIVRNINEVFQNKLKIVAESGCGDGDQERTLQLQWIHKLNGIISDLLEGYSQLDEAVGNAALRMDSSEEKMNRMLQTNKLRNFENDMKNLLEVIRRAINEKKWSAEGLKFEVININDVLSKAVNDRDSETSLSMKEISELKVQLQEKDEYIKKLFQEINHHKQYIQKIERSGEQSTSCDELSINTSTTSIYLKTPDDIEEKLKSCIEQLRRNTKELERKLQTKEEENVDLKKEVNFLKSELGEKHYEIKTLNKASIDTHVLVLEIADKHDTILKLRNEINHLEQRLRQADMQTHFKDDVIKELRRECRKMLKSKTGPITPPKSPDMHTLDTSYCESDSYDNRSDTDTETVICYDVTKSSSYQYNFMMDQLRKDNEKTKKDNDNKSRRILYMRFELLNMKTKILPAIDLSETSLEKIPGVLDSIDDEIRKTAVEFDNAKMFRDQLEPEYTIIVNVKQLLNEMIMKLSRFTDENIQLKTLIESLFMKIKELEENRSGNDKPSFVQKDLLDKLLATLNKITVQLSQMLNQSASAENLNSVAEGDDKIILNLLKDLKDEIESKDLVLDDKKIKISNLLEEISMKDGEIKCMKNECQSLLHEKNRNLEMISNLQSVIQTKSNSLSILIEQKTQLERQIEENERQIQNISEEKLKIDGESKNQLTTICNLRSALEEIKRNRNASEIHSNETIEHLSLNNVILSEQLHELFNENLFKDKQIQQFRDSNLEMRGQIYEMQQNLNDFTKIDILNKELDEYKNCKYELMKKDLELLKDKTNDIKSGIRARENDISLLNYFKTKCAEMEIQHSEVIKNLKMNYTKELQKLHNEITVLSEKILNLNQDKVHMQELLQDHSKLQDSIQDLSEQNELLEKSLQSYEDKYLKLETEIETMTHKNKNMESELQQKLLDIKRIEEKNLNSVSEHQKILSELTTLQKLCKCQHNGNDRVPKTSNSLQMKSLQKQLALKTAELAKYKEDFQNKSANFRKQEENLLEEKRKIDDGNSSLFKQIGQLKSKISMLDLTLAKKDDYIVNLNNKLLESTYVLNDLRTELANKNSALNDFEQNEIKMRSVIEILSEELDIFRQNDTLNQQNLYDEINNIRTVLKDKIETIKSHVYSAESLKAEIMQLSRLNENKQFEIESLKKELHEKQEKLISSEDKGNCLRELVQNMQEEMNNSKIEIGRLQNLDSELSYLKQKFQHLDSYNEDLKEKYEKLLGEQKKFKKFVAQFNETKGQYMNTVESTKSMLTEQEKRESVLNEKIMKLKEQVKLLQADRTTLLENLTDYHENNIILNSELEKYRDSDYVQQATSSLAHTTTLHKTYFPSQYPKIIKTHSNPDLNEVDPTLFKIKSMTSKLEHKRRTWGADILNSVEQIDSSYK